MAFSSRYYRSVIENHREVRIEMIYLRRLLSPVLFYTAEYSELECAVVAYYL